MKRKQKRRRSQEPIHGNIRRLREAAGLTQQQLADALAPANDGKPLDKTSISHWENGIAPPSSRFLTLLAELLKTTIDALFAEPSPVETKSGEAAA